MLPTVSRQRSLAGGEPAVFGEGEQTGFPQVLVIIEGEGGGGVVGGGKVMEFKSWGVVGVRLAGAKMEVNKVGGAAGGL